MKNKKNQKSQMRIFLTLFASFCLIFPVSFTFAKTKMISGTVTAIDTESSLITLQRTLKTGRSATYTVNYYSASKFSRGSGGPLTEEEIEIGDLVKTKVKISNGNYFAKKLTDLSIKYTKIQGSMGDVSETEDVFIIQTKKGEVTVNLEDNTDTIHKTIKQKNNPLTKAEAVGYFNSNTMTMYGTRSLTMWSR